MPVLRRSSGYVADLSTVKVEAEAIIRRLDGKSPI
jgi:6-pyruvoyl-tetrahydropterin synthase